MGLLTKKITAPAAPALAVTIIAQGTKLEGTFTLCGGLHVDGEFHGDILCAEQVSVGTTGSFIGRVKARQVMVSGRVEASIDCERLEITDTGQVIGEVVCTDLVIDGGGRFVGSRRVREAEPAIEADAEPAALTDQSSKKKRGKTPPLIGTGDNELDDASHRGAATA